MAKVIYTATQWLEEFFPEPESWTPSLPGKCDPWLETDTLFYEPFLEVGEPYQRLVSGMTTTGNTSQDYCIWENAVYNGEDLTRGEFRKIID